MATHWRLHYRTGEEGFETMSVLIENEEYKAIQKTLSEGADMIFLKDRPTIKRSMITSITNATDEVEYDKRMKLGLPTATPKELLKLHGEFRSFGDFAKETHFSFYEKMKWEHKNDCVCKKVDLNIQNIK